MQKNLTNLLLLLMISAFSIIKLNAQQQPSTAPLNPAFVKYMNDLNSGNINFPGEGEHGLGYMPSPVLRNFDNFYKNLGQNKKLVSYSSYYDMRNEGLVTSVKDQSSCETCWIFGSIASMESYCLKQGLGHMGFF